MIVDFSQVLDAPISGPIDEEILIPDEYGAVAKSLLKGWKIDILMIDAPELKVRAHVIWLRGNRAEIHMDYTAFVRRPLEDSFRTLLHELGHVKWTLAQSGEHVGEVVMDLVPHDDIAEKLQQEGATIDDARELIADRQRDLWLQEAEEAVGKDAHWSEKARFLANGRTVGT